MKIYRLLMIVGVICIVLSVGLFVRKRINYPAVSEKDPHATGAKPKRVPAHFEAAPSLSSLAPTLPPERFTGPTKEAYAAVREIPQTIAQLPCYCYCDEEHGHKSLHSCFEDAHAGSCAVCVKEALLAYRLEKEEKLTAAQIRERIIAMYSTTD